MKKINIFLLFSFAVSGLFGQVTLTYINNSPLPGDSSSIHEINYVNPGDPGDNQLWDLSGIQFTGKKNFTGVTENPEMKTSGVIDKSLILSDGGFDYTCGSGEKGYAETGYVNHTKKMTLDYIDPLTKMKYPLSYGGHFSDPFAGVAWYNNTTRIDLSGNYNVTADASGTLILPDRILKNTLRIKTVKQSLQIGVCGSTQSNIVKYYWYAPGYRYPVLMVSTTENSYGMKDPVITKTALVNLNQHSAGVFASSSDVANSSETVDNAVIVYPNPFSDQATYNYFLRKKIPVMVELYDMSGKLEVKVEQSQEQSEGLHTGVINAAVLGLRPGVYYLRFTMDKQVVVSKIVKI